MGGVGPEQCVGRAARRLNDIWPCILQLLPRATRQARRNVSVFERLGARPFLRWDLIPPIGFCLLKTRDDNGGKNRRRRQADRAWSFRNFGRTELSVPRSLSRVTKE